MFLRRDPDERQRLAGVAVIPRWIDRMRNDVTDRAVLVHFGEGRVDVLEDHRAHRFDRPSTVGG
jgi:hypothetical protein